MQKRAGSLVVNRNKELLLIYRKGKWDLPKGKVEMGEDYEAAGIREVEEECGIIDPIIETFLCETYHTYVFKETNVLKKTMWYVMNYSGAEVRPSGRLRTCLCSRVVSPGR